MPLNVGAGRAVMCSTDRAASDKGATAASVGAARDVVDGDHVDRVVDIGDEPELDASLDHSPDEVIRVSDWK